VAAPLGVVPDGLVEGQAGSDEMPIRLLPVTVLAATSRRPSTARIPRAGGVR
jgi:hypothetical protein